MARVQAIYDENSDASFRRQAQAKLDQTKARVANNRGIVNGIDVKPATQAEFQAARTAQAAKVPRVPSVPVAESVRVSDLNPAERTAFSRANPEAFNAAAQAEIKAAQAATNAAAAPRVATIADGVASAAAPAAAPAGRGGAILSGLGRVARSTPVKFAGRTGAALGALAGVGKVAEAGLDIADNGAGVKNIADLGAGGALVAGAWNPVAAAGGAGYLAGEAISDNISANHRELSDKIGGAANSVANFFGAGVDTSKPQPTTTFRHVTSPNDRAAAAAAAPVNSIDAGITPVAQRDPANPNDVLGTFNGKPITRARSDELQARGNVIGGAAPLAPQQPSTIASNVDVGGGARARVSEIASPNTAAGRMYAELKKDTTPTGKRVAADFLNEYVGGGTTERGDDLNRQSNAETIAAGRERSGNELGLAREQGKRRETVTGDDGSIYSITDGVISPVKDEGGKPAKLPKNNKFGIEQLKALEELVTARIGARDSFSGTDPEYAAARAEALNALMKQLGGADESDKKKDG